MITQIGLTKNLPSAPICRGNLPSMSSKVCPICRGEINSIRKLDPCCISFLDLKKGSFCTICNAGPLKNPKKHLINVHGKEGSNRSKSNYYSSKVNLKPPTKHRHQPISPKARSLQKEEINDAYVFRQINEAHVKIIKYLRLFEFWKGKMRGARTINLSQDQRLLIEVVINYATPHYNLPTKIESVANFYSEIKESESRINQSYRSFFQLIEEIDNFFPVIKRSSQEVRLLNQNQNVKLDGLQNKGLEWFDVK